MSSELRKPILIGERQRVPKFDNTNIGVSKIYLHVSEL